MARSVFAQAPQRAALAIGAALCCVWAGRAGIRAWAWPNLPDGAAHRYPAVPATPVPAAENAFLVYWKAGSAIALGDVPIDRWTLNAQQWRLRPEVAALVGRNEAPLTAFARANALTGYRPVRPRPGARPEYARLVDLGLLGLVASRLEFRGGRFEAGFARLGDTLLLGRRMMYAEGEPAVGRLFGIRVAEDANLLFYLEQEVLPHAPRSALAAFLDRLNALEALARPVSEELLAERNAHLHAFYASYPGLYGAVASLLPQAEAAGRLEALPLAEAAKRAREGGWFLKHAFWIGVIYDRPAARLARGDIAGYRAEIARYEQWPWQRALGELIYPSETSLAWRMQVASRTPLRMLLAEARFETLRVRLARELAHRDGKPDAGWPSLVPAYLPRAPKDPFAPHQPLSLDASGLCSVGWDGVKQGTPPIDMRHPRALADWELVGDIRLL